MNETKTRHSAGPWTIERIVEADDRIHYAIHAPGRIGVMYYIEDARLVAAAPEMFDALRAVLEFADDGIAIPAAIREDVRAAIANAEGRKA